jgi:hypothetical protein
VASVAPAGLAPPLAPDSLKLTRARDLDEFVLPRRTELIKIEFE